MNVYLAARYRRRDEIAAYAEELDGLGYTVSASWLSTTDAQERAAQRSPWVAGEHARNDLEEVGKAGVFILFSDPPGEAHTGGGRHVELGYAICVQSYQRRLRQKPLRVIVVGPRQTIFHSLEVIEQYDTWPEALAQLQRG